jgi:hypothetical protein
MSKSRRQLFSKNLNAAVKSDPALGFLIALSIGYASSKFTLWLLLLLPFKFSSLFQNIYIIATTINITGTILMAAYKKSK